MVPVKAEIEVMRNTSAHSDYRETLAWLSHYKKAPHKIFITHGEKTSANSLKKKIHEKFGWKSIVPHYQMKEILK